MSYDVRLGYPNGGLVKVPRHEEGGTFAVGGTSEAEFNITYNYGPFFRKHIDQQQGLSWLHGKRAKDCIQVLSRAIIVLGTIKSADYWEPTEGNAGYALSILLGWARLHPDGVFEVD